MRNEKNGEPPVKNSMLVELDTLLKAVETLEGLNAQDQLAVERWGYAKNTSLLGPLLYQFNGEFENGLCNLPMFGRHFRMCIAKVSGDAGKEAQHVIDRITPIMQKHFPENIETWIDVGDYGPLFHQASASEGMSCDTLYCRLLPQFKGAYTPYQMDKARLSFAICQPANI